MKILFILILVILTALATVCGQSLLQRLFNPGHWGHHDHPDNFPGHYPGPPSIGFPDHFPGHNCDDHHGPPPNDWNDFRGPPPIDWNNHRGPPPRDSNDNRRPPPRENNNRNKKDKTKPPVIVTTASSLAPITVSTPVTTPTPTTVITSTARNSDPNNELIYDIDLRSSIS